MGSFAFLAFDAFAGCEASTDTSKAPGGTEFCFRLTVSDGSGATADDEVLVRWK